MVVPMRLMTLMGSIYLASCSSLFGPPEGDSSEPASDAGMGVPCADLVCDLNAFCDSSVAPPTCRCLDGYTGPNCEVNTDDCVTAPCANGGVCVDRVTGFECYCTDEWAGELCTCPISRLSLAGLDPPGASALLDLGDLRISSPTGQVYAGFTLGVLGGHGDSLIDGKLGDEALEFLFTLPATSVSIDSNIVGAGDGFLGAVEIEAFDEAGVSLGLAQMSGTQSLSLYTVFGDQPMRSFTMTANTAGWRGLSSIRYQLQCE